MLNLIASALDVTSLTLSSVRLSDTWVSIHEFESYSQGLDNYKILVIVYVLYLIFVHKMWCLGHLAESPRPENSEPTLNVYEEQESLF